MATVVVSGSKPTNVLLEEAEVARLRATRAYMPTTTIDPSQIIDGVFLGSEQDAVSFKFVSENNICYILNVADEVTASQQSGVSHVKILIEDLMNPPNNQYPTFEETFALIDKAIAESKGILVHCARGRSRSATVIIGYLMSRKKLSLLQAHTLVKRKRPIVGPHHYLQLQLIDFETHLTGNSTSTMVPEDFYINGELYGGNK